jgi:hypothetical protein
VLISAETESEEAAEALIRQRVEEAAKAIGTKDIDRVMSLYAPNLVSFDIGPPSDTSELTVNVEPGKKPSLHFVPSRTRYAT